MDLKTYQSFFGVEFAAINTLGQVGMNLKLALIVRAVTTQTKSPATISHRQRKRPTTRYTAGCF
jgi:hypothetical protein